MDNNISKKDLYDQRKQEKLEISTQRRQAKKTKSTITWIVTIVVIIGAIFFMIKLAKNNSGPATTITTTEEITAQDHVLGNPSAPLVLVEYSDFQCPACAFYEPIISQITAEYPNKLAIVYRHFPLKSIHPNAEPAARASEAASLQDAFWPMHDLLFTNQTKWADLPDPKKKFLIYAEDLGLDLVEFETDYASKAVADRVDSDYNASFALGLNSTPTFFLNGIKIQNPRSVQDLRTLIDSALNLIQAEASINPNEAPISPATNL